MILKNYLPGSLKKNFPFAHGSRWYFEYRAKNINTGKPERVRKTFNINRIHDYNERLSEADRIFDILISINEKTEKIVSKSPVSISDCIKKAVQIKENRTERDKSATTYTSIAEIFMSWLRSQFLADIDAKLMTRQMAIAFLDYALIDRKVSNTTHNNYINILRNIFNVMLDRGYINDNPFSKLQELATDQKLRKPLSDYEKMVIMEEIRASHDKTLEMAVGFIYYTLIRPTELRRMRFRDVDLQKGLITLNGTQTKNHKPAKLTMDINFIKLLHNLNFYKYDPEFLIFGQGGKPHFSIPIGEHTLNNRHHKILLKLHKKIKLDISGISIYSWKDTGACNLLESGLNINDLRQHIRHSDLNDTQRYLRQFVGVNDTIRSLGLKL